MCLHATTFQSPKVEERSPGLRIRQGIFGGTMLYGSRNGKDGKPIPKTQLQGIFARLFWLLTFFFAPSPAFSLGFSAISAENSTNSHNQKAKSSNAAAAALPFHLTARKFFI